MIQRDKFYTVSGFMGKSAVWSFFIFFSLTSLVVQLAADS